MPPKSWRKLAIIGNLKLRKVPLPSGVRRFEKLTIPALLALSSEYPIRTKYLIEDMAEKSGRDVKVLWLPVSHCEFNAIEEVWSEAKRYIARHNKEGGREHVLNLAKIALTKVTPDKWSNYCDEAIRMENVMKTRDALLDESLHELFVLENNNNEIDDEADEDCICQWVFSAEYILIHTTFLTIIFYQNIILLCITLYFVGKNPLTNLSKHNYYTLVA